jgi:hypothetical protein
MPSLEYFEIRDAIEDTTTNPSWALYARYQGDASSDASRKFLAYLLGGSPQPGGPPQEVVLAYQYEGPHTAQPHPSKLNWRCFKVGMLIADSSNPDPNLQVQKIPFAPTTNFDPPPPLSNADVNRQNCITTGIAGPKVRRLDEYES